MQLPQVQKDSQNCDKTKQRGKKEAGLLEAKFFFQQSGEWTVKSRSECPEGSEEQGLESHRDAELPSEDDRARVKDLKRSKSGISDPKGEAAIDSKERDAGIPFELLIIPTHHVLIEQGVSSENEGRYKERK